MYITKKMLCFTQNIFLVAVLMWWGRDVVGFKILRGFYKLEQGSGVLLQKCHDLHHSR